MLGERRVRQLAQTVLSLSPADQTEVVVSAADEAVTRFANNTIHQNVAETDATVEVRVAFGRRVGMASGNNLSAGALASIVEAACEIARHLPENPEFPGLPGPRRARAVHSFDEAAAAASPELRARAVGDICRAAAARQLRAAGAYSTSALEFAVANSLGVWAYHPSTSVDLTLVAANDLGSGYAHDVSWRLDRVNAEALGAEAIERALASHASPPRRAPPGEYPVVLEPYAVADILDSLAEVGMGALAVQEGRSWMNGRLGRRVLSPLISIWDDGLDPDGEPQPFDCEGVPKQRVDIVRAGVPTAPVYDTHTAAREPGRSSTGHAQPLDEDWDGPMPANLHLAPGGASLKEMIETTGRGLYITRFWYTSVVSEHDCVLTGMTRDGTFLVERGEVVGPAHNLRFTHSLVEALAGVEALGREARSVGGAYGSLRLPAMKLESFRFTGGTDR